MLVGLMMKFQSTRPVRGATFSRFRLVCLWIISIHAPRAGRDQNLGEFALRYNYFNPRAPCGARLGQR